MSKGLEVVRTRISQQTQHSSADILKLVFYSAQVPTNRMMVLGPVMMGSLRSAAQMGWWVWVLVLLMGNNIKDTGLKQLAQSLPWWPIDEGVGVSLGIGLKQPTSTKLRSCTAPVETHWETWVSNWVGGERSVLSLFLELRKAHHNITHCWLHIKLDHSEEELNHQQQNSTSCLRFHFSCGLDKGISDNKIQMFHLIWFAIAFFALAYTQQYNQ